MNNIIGIFVGQLYFPPELMRKWDEKNLEIGGIGGSEIWAIELANKLELSGYHCMIFADCENWHFSNEGVEYIPFRLLNDVIKYQHFLCFITSRKTSILSNHINADTTILMLHDTLVLDAASRDALHLDKIDYIAYQSDFQKEKILEKYGDISENKFFRTFQALNPNLYNDSPNVKKENKMLWSTHKIRGARFLITRVLPLIRQEIPDFKIEVCGYVNDTTDDYFKTDGVEILGTLSKKDLIEHQKSSKIWIYPNWGKYDNGWTIEETFCITAIENALAKNALIVADKTCFSSTLKGYCGFTGTECFPENEYVLTNEEQMQAFARALADKAIIALKDDEYRSKLASSAFKICENYTWDNAAKTFISIFDKPNMFSVKKYNKSLNQLQNHSNLTTIKEPVNLVYHLWVPSKWGEWENRIFNLHMSCLSDYSHLFTNAIFVLSMDNRHDKNKIKEIEKRIASIGWNGNLKFDIRDNNSDLREGITFYNDIIKSLNNYDGLTFFAHSKGLTNNISGGTNG